MKRGYVYKFGHGNEEVIMAKYRYKASNMDGQTIEGIFEASTEEDVRSMLRQKSFFPIEMKAVEVNTKEIVLFPKISAKHLTIFCQQFAAILKAGVPLVQGLSIMADQCEDKKLVKVLVDVYENVQTGTALSEAFRNHNKRFPDIFISMIEAGEVSGTLDNSFERMGITFKKDYKINQKIKNAMIYPVAVAFVAIVIVWYLLTEVVPTFERIFANAGERLPVPTRILIVLSEFVQNNGLLILGIVLFIVILFRIAFTNPRGKFILNKFKLVVPVIGKLNIKILSSRFTRTLSTLFAAGVPLTEALDITAHSINNAYAERGIMEVSEQVKQGRNLSSTLEALNLFPSMVGHMTRVGEESGTLDDMLTKTSEYYDGEADSAVTKMMALLEPTIIVVLGGIVMFIVMAILMPMFNLGNMMI